MHVKLALPLALTLAAAACGNVPRSRDLANAEVSGTTLAQQVCSNCHGISGDSISPNMPKLAAQQREYLGAQLRGFRSHSRQDPAGFEYMWGISRSLTDKQIDELADYYARQQAPRPAPAPESPAQVRGRALVTTGAADHGVPPCASCHGDKAQGNGKFPRLAGQHADYLAKQLSIFQRTNDRPEAAVMKSVAHALSRDDIEAAAAYLQSINE
jgi:cytochrome c553